MYVLYKQGKREIRFYLSTALDKYGRVCYVKAEFIYVSSYANNNAVSLADRRKCALK